MPPPADPERAARGLERWHDAAAASPDDALRGFAADLVADPAGRRLIEGLAGNSPYLTQLLLRDLDFARHLILDGPDAAFATALATPTPEGAERDAVARMLRRVKSRGALTVALADILDIWPLETATARLSELAEATLDRAMAVLLNDAAARGKLAVADPARPLDGAGYVALGMGKLGAGELNYSSDIDLIVLFDPQRQPAGLRDELPRTWVRITRDLVKLMEERTADGYVFRTDLRLRPDPGATPVALSVDGAVTYYESMGQNWERAAMIKARPVAGDLAVGRAFLDEIAPFVWRKHLDFAAIEDIHSIKRQIHRHKGGGAIAVEGHNIKLGRGGIREIEFFAQTQQLIWGGREPRVRTSGTIATLNALVETGHVVASTAERLAVAYRFLRRLEHRLQMIDDQQTHTLPTDPAGFAALATFLGYAEPEDLRRDVVSHLQAVEAHYAELFEEAPSLGGPTDAGGNLVFTGGDHDPETLKTLTAMGFDDAEAVSAAVRAWHHGRYRATRSTRSRELLTALKPQLLAALAATANPDQAFRRFDSFLENLPSGVQLFSLFNANTPLLGLVATIMGTAPRLADWLGRNPLLLDAVLTQGFMNELPEPATQAAESDARMSAARDMQDVLDLSRRWANDAKFRVDIQVLRGTADIDVAGRALTDVADVVIRGLLPRVGAEFATPHGRCPGDGMAVLGLGKLGGREMTARSDLDVVFIYDMPEGAAGSDGKRSLAPPHYYQRLAQRLINALTAPTAEGKLYEVDARLRPSGNAGPLAVSLEGFATYQLEQAWIWEHMALTRARVVAGAPALAARIDAAVRAALTAPRDSDTLLRGVAEMRARIDAEHHTTNPWRPKHRRGGLVDCEFIAQYLLLRHAQAHPEVLSPNTVTAFERLAAAGLLDQRVASELIEATRLWLRLQGWLRLTVEGEADDAALPPALQAELAHAGGAEDLAELRSKVAFVADRTLAHYEAIVGEPAARLGPAPERVKEAAK